MMYQISGKSNNFYETNHIKFNYKCPKGTVDDSNKCVTSVEEVSPKDFESVIAPIKNDQYPDVPFRSISRSKLKDTDNIQLNNIPKQHVKTLFDNVKSLDSEITRLKLPKLRGIVTEPDNSAGMASMMDGILAVTPSIFRDDPEAEVKLLIARNVADVTNLNNNVQRYSKLLENEKLKWEKNNKKLVESGAKFEESTYFMFGEPSRWKENLEASEKQLKLSKERLADLKTNGPAALKSSWKSDNDPARRPFATDEYFDFKNRTKLLLQHEFAHHIHQQYKVNASNYSNPPMERDIAKIHAKCQKDNTLISASKYGDSEPQEWFAESYVLYKNNREDLVTPALLEYFRKKKL